MESRIINNNYLFKFLTSEPLGSFFMPKILIYSFFRVARMVDKKTVEWSGREMIDCINHFSMLHFKGHNSHFPLKK